MIASNGAEYRLGDTTWSKYDSGFHAWLVEACEPDEYDGDTDFGGASLFGRRVDYWNSQGFHSLETFKTAQEAQEAFQAWVDEFNGLQADWAAEAGEPCYVCGGKHSARTCGYCETCSDYHPADDRHNVR